MLYVATWCVSIRPVVTRVKEELQFGLILSETCRASNEKIKFNHRNMCIYTYYVIHYRYYEFIHV